MDYSFIEQARQGKFTLVLSDLTIKELQTAPEYVRNTPATIPSEYLEIVSITDEHLELADRYVREGALPFKCHSDAQHIAISSVIDIRTPKEIVYGNN